MVGELALRDRSWKIYTILDNVKDTIIGEKKTINKFADTILNTNKIIWSWGKHSTKKSLTLADRWIEKIVAFE